MSQNDIANQGNIGGYYDQRYRGLPDGRVTIAPDGWPRDRFEALVWWSGTGERILDVGCGDGRVLYNLRERFRELHGTEVSDQRIMAAQNTLRGLAHNIHDGNVESGIAYEDNFFDCVVSADVIEHLIDVRSALREMVRILRPGGTLVLATPNVAGLKKRIRLLLGKFPSTSDPQEGLISEPVDGLLDGGHFHYFTYTMLHRLLKQAGCVGVESYGIGKYGSLHNLRPSLLSGNCVVTASKPGSGEGPLIPNPVEE